MTSIRIGGKADSTRAHEAMGSQSGTQRPRAREAVPASLSAAVSIVTPLAVAKQSYRIRGAFRIADGRHLRAARIAAGLSRAELAKATGYSAPAVKVWERQIGRPPSSTPTTMERIEAVLRIHGVEVENDPPTIRIIRNG